MTGLEYVLNQLGLALQAAERRIAELEAELARRDAGGQSDG